MARSLRRAARVRPSSPAISVPVMGPLRRTISAIFSVYHLVEWDSPPFFHITKKAYLIFVHPSRTFPCILPSCRKRLLPHGSSLSCRDYYQASSSSFLLRPRPVSLSRMIRCSTWATIFFVNFTASGLTDILSMPLSTRNSANSG